MSETGHNYGFWVSGHVVYTACIFIVNIVMFHRFYVHDGYSEISILMMIASYILTYLLFSQNQNQDEVFCTFTVLFGDTQILLQIGFCCALVSFTEVAYKAFTGELLKESTEVDLPPLTIKRSNTMIPKIKCEGLDIDPKAG